MEFTLLLVLCCLSSVLWVTTSQAALSPEEYWKSKFPNLMMPKPIKDILPNDTSKFSAIVDNGGVLGNHDIDALYEYFTNYCDGLMTKEPDEVANAKRPDQIPSFYFFLETDLHEGKTMKLDFPEKTSSGTFLPRNVAQTIPFSLVKISEILNRFSIAEDSVKAQNIKSTLNFCYSPDIKAEKKICATSLESLVDFVKDQLGNPAATLSTKVYGQNRVQNYRIAGAVKKLTVDDEKAGEVTCHKKNYIYAVFYCHKLKNTRAYLVPLVGEDGTRANAVAVCHGDTAQMSPTFWAFRVLGIKPGTLPICHFLPQDHHLFYN